jgi:hypothetical protein
MVPVVIYEVVGNGSKSVAYGTLGFLPLTIQNFLNFLEIGVLLTAVGCSCRQRCNPGRMVAFGLLGSRELGKEARLEYAPCIVSHGLGYLYSCFERFHMPQNIWGNRRIQKLRSTLDFQLANRLGFIRIMEIPFAAGRLANCGQRLWGRNWRRIGG